MEDEPPLDDTGQPLVKTFPRVRGPLFPNGYGWKLRADHPLRAIEAFEAPLVGNLVASFKRDAAYRVLRIELGTAKEAAAAVGKEYGEKAEEFKKAYPDCESQDCALLYHECKCYFDEPPRITCRCTVCKCMLVERAKVGRAFLAAESREERARKRATGVNVNTAPARERWICPRLEEGYSD